MSVRLVLAVVVPVLCSATAVVTTHAFEAGDPRREGAPTDTGERRLPAAERLRIGGTGSALAIVRALAAAFGERERAAGRSANVVVHRSIGSGGGVRATADGALDLGLASRALKESETRLGLVQIRFASTPVVLAAHPSVRDRSITTRRLRALILGRPVFWRNGHPAVFLQRERGDSSIVVLQAAIPELTDAMEVARAQGLWRVLHQDRQMEEALEETPDAVGFHDLGAIRIQSSPLRVVFLDDLDPTSPTYPYVKELSFLSRGPPRGLANRFVSFALSEPGQRIAEEGGYRP